MEMRETLGNSMELVACPFCKSRDTEMIALFGQQMMTSQYYCNNCHTGFEAVKWDDNPQSPITNYELPQ